MNAAVPQIILDLTTLIAFLLALIALAVAVAKVNWLRTLYSYLIVAPFSRWFRNEVAQAAVPLQEQIDNHFGYVQYHLGPNGDTTPIHQRLVELEAAAGIHDPEGQWPTLDP